MPFNFSIDAQQLGGTMTAVVSVVTAAAAALWIAMIIWAYRDMRSRSRDVFAQVLTGAVVAILNVPGLLMYLILRPQETLAEQYQRALEEEALLQDIEEKQVCPGCNHPIKETWRLCPYCHTKLKKTCAHCGQLLDLPWTVCPYCEYPQVETSYQARRSVSVPSADASYSGRDTAEGPASNDLASQ